MDTQSGRHGHTDLNLILHRHGGFDSSLLAPAFWRNMKQPPPWSGLCNGSRADALGSEEWVRHETHPMDFLGTGKAHLVANADSGLRPYRVNAEIPICPAEIAICPAEISICPAEIPICPDYGARLRIRHCPGRFVGLALRLSRLPTPLWTLGESGISAGCIAVVVGCMWRRCHEAASVVPCTPPAHQGHGNR